MMFGGFTYQSVTRSMQNPSGAIFVAKLTTLLSRDIVDVFEPSLTRTTLGLNNAGTAGTCEAMGDNVVYLCATQWEPISELGSSPETNTNTTTAFGLQCKITSLKTVEGFDKDWVHVTAANVSSNYAPARLRPKGARVGNKLHILTYAYGPYSINYRNYSGRLNIDIDTALTMTSSSVNGVRGEGEQLSASMPLGTKIPYAVSFWPDVFVRNTNVIPPHHLGVEGDTTSYSGTFAVYNEDLTLIDGSLPGDSSGSRPGIMAASVAGVHMAACHAGPVALIAGGKLYSGGYSGNVFGWTSADKWEPSVGDYALQDKEVTPTKSEQVLIPDEEYYGLRQITVKPIPDKWQDVSPVTARAEDVLLGKDIVGSTGEVIRGQMANRGEATVVLDDMTTREQEILPGYYSGGKVKLTDDLDAAVAAAVTAGVTSGVETALTDMWEEEY